MKKRFQNVLIPMLCFLMLVLAIFIAMAPVESISASASPDEQIAPVIVVSAPAPAPAFASVEGLPAPPMAVDSKPLWVTLTSLGLAIMALVLLASLIYKNENSALPGSGEAPRKFPL